MLGVISIEERGIFWVDFILIIVVLSQILLVKVMAEQVVQPVDKILAMEPIGVVQLFLKANSEVH